MRVCSDHPPIVPVKDVFQGRNILYEKQHVSYSKCQLQCIFTIYTNEGKTGFVGLADVLKKTCYFLSPPQAEMKISTGTLCIYLSNLVLLYPCDKTAHGGI